MNSPDSIKYLLYDVIKAILPYCTNEKEFQDYLQSKGVNVEFKLKRTTEEIEGISFSYDNDLVHLLKYYSLISEKYQECSLIQKAFLLYLHD